MSTSGGMPRPATAMCTGIANTETRFSIYLPPAELYQGRFLQHITLCRTASTSRKAWGASRTRSGSPSRVARTSWRRTVAGLRADRAPRSTPPSRRIAPTRPAPSTPADRRKDVRRHRPYGYAHGGSGGGYRTIGGAENTSAVLDGFVPYAIGSPMAIPNMFTVRMHAQRILRRRFDQIVDAVEPGGSGDPYEGLDPEERDALTEVTRMGFPLRSWFGYRTMRMHAFPVLYGGVAAADSFFEEYWTEPGYLGAAMPASLSVIASRKTLRSSG